MPAPSARYIALLKELYRVNMNNPVKMGLQNTLRLNELLGDPIGKVPVVHVAGTNGKGSVSLKTAEALRRSGFRTGLFVSPHISSFRERIQVDGEPMSEEDVVTMLPELLALCTKHDIPATFFELTTLLSFMRFGKAECDAIVLEVGLGGRLDSTNIVTPALSVITSIQLDHTKILGDTIEKIALEKAGIMKPGVPVLVGPGCPLDVMSRQAALVGSPYYTLDKVLSPSQLCYRRRLSGNDIVDDIDDLNLDISRAALTLLQRSPTASKKFHSLFSAPTLAPIEAGLASRPPCRYQVFSAGDGIDVILDIAHNEDAIIALVAKLKAQYGGVGGGPLPRVVLGMSADKDVTKCLEALLGLYAGAGGEGVRRVHCTAARHPRAMSGQELRALLGSLASATSGGSASADVPAPDVLPVTRALSEAIELTRAELLAEGKSSSSTPPRRAVVVVCGTAFIMSEARAALGVVEPRDGDFLSTDERDAQESFAAPSSR